MTSQFSLICPLILITPTAGFRCIDLSLQKPLKGPSDFPVELSFYFLPLVIFSSAELSQLYTKSLTVNCAI